MNVEDLLLPALTLLLPLTALFVVREENFLHAVVARGLFGLAAALIYALMGAPDVALVEVLMGALLVTLLYIVVFNRSREVRVGYLSEESLHGEAGRLVEDFFRRERLRFRGVSFERREDLEEALAESLIDMALADGVFPGSRHFPTREGAPPVRLVLPEEAEDLLALLEAHLERSPS